MKSSSSIFEFFGALVVLLVAVVASTVGFSILLSVGYFVTVLVMPLWQVPLANFFPFCVGVGLQGKILFTVCSPPFGKDDGALARIFVLLLVGLIAVSMRYLLL